MLDHDDVTTAEATGSPGTKQARGRERRSAILEAAARLFTEQGIDTSIAAVAREVGITDAGLLYHFPTKEELVLAVLKRRDARNAPAAFSTPGTDALETLRALGEWGKVMEQDEAFTCLHLMLSAEHVAEPTPLHDYFRQRYETVLTELADVIRRGQEQGQIRADVDPEAEASALLAVQDGARLQWFYSGRQTSIAETVRRYVGQTIDRLAAT